MKIEDVFFIEIYEMLNAFEQSATEVDLNYPPIKNSQFYNAIKDESELEFTYSIKANTDQVKQKQSDTLLFALRILSLSSNLISLTIEERNWNEEIIQATKIIATFPYLISLNICGNDLPKYGSPVINELQKASCLQKFIIEGSDLGKNITLILGDIKSLPNLITLGLSDNKFGENIQKIIQLISNTDSILYVKINPHLASIHCITELENIIVANDLNFSGNNLDQNIVNWIKTIVGDHNLEIKKNIHEYLAPISGELSHDLISLVGEYYNPVVNLIISEDFTY